MALGIIRPCRQCAQGTGSATEPPTTNFFVTSTLGFTAGPANHKQPTLDCSAHEIQVKEGTTRSARCGAPWAIARPHGLCLVYTHMYPMTYPPASVYVRCTRECKYMPIRN